jgi:hypothetical protein
MVYYETIQQLRNEVRALREEVNAVSSQKNEQDENLEKLREEHINLMSQMSGAKISKGKLEKKVREETNEVDKEIDVDCPYAEIGRNVIVMLKHVKRVLEEFNARNGPKSRRSTHEVERVEGLRKFYNQLLMAVVSIGKGKGVRNSSASLLQRELGYRPKSSTIYRAIVGRMEATSAASNSELFAEKVLPASRRKRKDALSEKDIEIITTGFEECSEVSPNANDLVRRMKLVSDGTDSRFDVHQRHYIYKTLEEVQTAVHQRFSTKYSLAMLSTHRPYYVHKGKVNGCMCHRCENLREMIKATSIAKYAQILCRPFIVNHHVQTIARFVRAIGAVHHCRLWERSEKMSRKSWNRMLYLWQCVLPYHDHEKRVSYFHRISIIDLMGYRYKRDLLNLILCPNAMPDMRREYRSGKVGCYSNRERSCCKCKANSGAIRSCSQGYHGQL